MTTGRINQVANPLFVTASWPLLGGPASSRTPEKRRAGMGEWADRTGGYG